MSKKASALVDSLCKGSFTRKATQNVISTSPGGYEVQIVEIGHLPLYDFNYDDPTVTDFPTPLSYVEFRETIKTSAGVLFVTSENNHAVPAYLKDIINIGSRPDADVAWKKIPAGIINHSVGRMGGYSVQKNLYLALSYFNMSLTGQPEVFPGNLPTLSDDNGRLIESACEFVQDHVDQLAALTERNPE